MYITQYKKDIKCKYNKVIISHPHSLVKNNQVF